LPADGGHVIGDGVYPRFGLPDAIGADKAAKADPVDGFGALELPGVALVEPVLGRLDLPAIVETLAEHAVLVADAVADCRDPQRRKRVEEARRQPAQAAIAKRRVRLVGDDRVIVQAARLDRRARLIFEAQIDGD